MNIYIINPLSPGENIKMYLVEGKKKLIRKNSICDTVLHNNKNDAKEEI